jgi:hypothetical protein
VTVGSIFLIDDAAREGLNPMLDDESSVVFCAATTAISGGNAVKNFMARRVWGR